MDKNYKMSPEIEKFFKDKENQKLINYNQWKEVLYKASKTKGLLISELIYVIVSGDIEEVKDRQMTIGLSDELNKIIQNNEILEEMLNKLK